MILVGSGLENSYDRDDFRGISRRKIRFFVVVLFEIGLFFFSFVSWFDVFLRFSMIQKYFRNLFSTLLISSSFVVSISFAIIDCYFRGKESDFGIRYFQWCVLFDVLG